MPGTPCRPTPELNMKILPIIVIGLALLITFVCGNESNDNADTQRRENKLELEPEPHCDSCYTKFSCNHLEQMRDIFKQELNQMSPKREWRKVKLLRLNSTIKAGVDISHSYNTDGGLIISGKVTANGCGKGHGSGFVSYINGDWSRIMYTQEFSGSASCWTIFGYPSPARYAGGTPLQTDPAIDTGVYPLDITSGDIIFNQEKMGSKSINNFGYNVQRCDNEQDNFWHGNNGSGKRRATVMLRRNPETKLAGIITGTSCGTPSFVIRDIYVYE